MHSKLGFSQTDTEPRSLIHISRPTAITSMVYRSLHLRYFNSTLPKKQQRKEGNTVNKDKRNISIDHQYRHTRRYHKRASEVERQSCTSHEMNQTEPTKKGSSWKHSYPATSLSTIFSTVLLSIDTERSQRMTTSESENEQLQ